MSNEITQTNEFMEKLNSIKTKFEAVTQQVAQGNDELKRLQGEYRATVELGLKLGFLVEEKTTETLPEPESEPELVDDAGC